MKKIILTDIDDVCLHWEYPFHTWMETHGYEKQPDPKGYQWDVTKTYGLSEEESLRIIRMFNDSAAIGFLPPFRDAQFYIKMLHEKHQYQFVAVTASSSDEYAKKLRIRNLQKIFGDNTFLEYHILPIGACKYDILEELKEKYEGCFWVEDSPRHAKSGAELGYRSLLMLHGRNKLYKNDKGLTPVVGWEDIYNMVLKENDDKFMI